MANEFPNILDTTLRSAVSEAMAKAALHLSFIKFDPEKIMEESVNIDRQHKLFVQHTAAIKKKADSTKNIWRGDSAQLYAEKITELDARSVEIAKMMAELSQDLANASGIYKKGEEDAKTKAQGLPTEGVFKG